MLVSKRSDRLHVMTKGDIVVSGGPANAPGLGPRLQNEISKLCGREVKVVVAGNR